MHIPSLLFFIGYLIAVPSYIVLARKPELYRIWSRVSYWTLLCVLPASVYIAVIFWPNAPSWFIGLMLLDVFRFGAISKILLRSQTSKIISPRYSLGWAALNAVLAIGVYKYFLSIKIC